MFQDNQILGQIFSLLVIGGFVYASIRMTKDLVANDKINFLLVLIVSVLVGVWFIDNVIAFKTELLDKEENKFVLQALWSIVTFVLGRQSNKDK
jgi:hypothetical protein